MCIKSETFRNVTIPHRNASISTTLMTTILRRNVYVDFYCTQTTA